jgi:hypothetical protein
MRIFIAVVCCLLFASSALADDPSRTIVRAIVDTTGDSSQNAQTLTLGDWDTKSQVTVTCYYWAPPGTVCAGGGDFDDSGTCDVGTDNGATKIRNTHNGHCWYRKNFGLNGVADARQCGVIGDGLPSSNTAPNTAGYHPDDAAFLQNCLTVASNSGIPVVSTGGGVILDNTTNIAPPANMALTCGASAFDTSGNDYRIFKNNGNALNLAKAIVLDPTGSSGGYHINLLAKNTTLFGCTIEAGAGPPNPDTHIYPNPYSPSVFYPDCDPASPRE